MEKKRFQNPLTDLETFRANNKNQLVEIGNRTNSYKNIGSQYMGVFKKLIQARGIILKKNFLRIKRI